MKAINIKWDTDGDQKLLEKLPSSIEIPDKLANHADDKTEEISDYISDVAGFCHFGFELSK